MWVRQFVGGVTQNFAYVVSVAWVHKIMGQGRKFGVGEKVSG